MSTLRPFRAYSARGYIGNFFIRQDAERLFAPVGRAVIIDERTGDRFRRRLDGRWEQDGVDRVTATARRQRTAQMAAAE